MYIQIINFQLEGIGAEDYAGLCDQLAPGVGAQSGLVSKVWLADPATNTYGGVYTWRDRQAMEDFTRTELFNAVATHPNLANVTSRGFAVLEAPTRVTRGLLEVTA